jgi:hypothetical protein
VAQKRRDVAMAKQDAAEGPRDLGKTGPPVGGAREAGPVVVEDLADDPVEDEVDELVLAADVPVQ